MEEQTFYFDEGTELSSDHESPQTLFWVRVSGHLRLQMEALGDAFDELRPKIEMALNIECRINERDTANWDGSCQHDAWIGVCNGSFYITDKKRSKCWKL